MNKDDYLIQRLSRSDLYNEFRQAFVAGTCLPLKPHASEFRSGRPDSGSHALSSLSDSS